MGTMLWVTGLALAATLSAGPSVADSGTEKPSGGSAKVHVAKMLEAEGRITALDSARRNISVKTPQGKELTVYAGDRVKRLADFRVGDTVRIEYYEPLALHFFKVEAGVDGIVCPSELLDEPSQLPKGISSRQATLTGNVTAFDLRNSTVTLRSEGRSVTMKADRGLAARVSVGDRVYVVYSEAVAASVSRAKKP
jgi:hypothetical protein